MYNNNFLDNATKFVIQAVECDKKSDLREALRLYDLSLKYFDSAIKYEKNEKTKSVIISSVNIYIARAQEINELLKNGELGSQEGGGGNGSGNNIPKGNGYKEKSNIKEEEENINNENNSFRLSIKLKKVIDPTTKWEDIIGMNKTKELLFDNVILSKKLKHLYNNNCKTCKGLLLYGPPGNGKTYIAQALATKTSPCSFYSISSADLISKWVGDSAKYIRALFDEAKENKPSIIFIDEIESICNERGGGNGNSSNHNESGALTEFLIQMEGFSDDMDDILVIGATNLPWKLDKAIRSRFKKRIYIPLPDSNTRKMIFKNKLKNEFNSFSDNDFNELSLLTNYFSSRDISFLISSALQQTIDIIKNATHFKYFNNSNKIIPCSPNDINAFELDFDEEFLQKGKDASIIVRPPVKLFHFKMILYDIKPSVSENDLNQFIEWTSQYGEES